jgi:hypothetical protein
MFVYLWGRRGKAGREKEREIRQQEGEGGKDRQTNIRAPTI